MHVRGLSAFYGPSQVLFDIDFHVAGGSVTALLGRNGMGKTTTVRSIMGLMAHWDGAIDFDGVDLSGLAPHRIAALGIGLVPEGRRIFPNLSVRENLVATAANRQHVPDPWTLERVVAIFPNLAARWGNAGWQLSGGEQQMVAIGRALMTNPRLLILDEATEGLSPLMRDEIWTCLALLKSIGMSILVIDKNLDKLLALADQHVILEKGRVVWKGSSASLLIDSSVRERYLGV